MTVANFSQQRWLGNSVAFWLLSAFLVLVFCTGGSGRYDVQSLVILRPTAAIICGIAIWMIRREHASNHRHLLVALTVVLFCVGIYVLPLPASLIPDGPAYAIGSEVIATAGLGSGQYTISLLPYLTWNSLSALLVPAAVLLLGVQLSGNERLRLLPIFIGLGLVSGILALLQLLTGPDGPFYLYRITNNGFAVGFFANRNHQALVLACLFPMLAAFSTINVKTFEQAKLRSSIAIAIGVILVPLLLVTGSRAGLVLGVAGLVSVMLIYRSPDILNKRKQSPSKIGKTYLMGICGILGLGLLTLWASRAEALRRILAPDQGQDIRFQTWGSILDIGSEFSVTGSGPGTFPSMFQIYETAAQLRAGYLNQAHNDWLDLYLTTGIAGLVLLAVATVAVSYACLKAFRAHMGASRKIAISRVGAVVVVLIMIASFFDYPLRTPAVASLFAVVLLWLLGNPVDRTERAGSI
jgi:O-antigen ligase